ncbi:hypothetical protein OOK36_00720 [Streptomyces sp. NBC_00365]|uniref:hypothetical protein n=1 Tax=Streptomyces sp. NBC_00365 TaxID=2975726 RepID=UPI002255219F|nr:hypothetical protein [Streptomyces sp. NBC_00365]MCX5087478.1 hypothetical protein [Streptomyces sp. NBC_00365]
MRDASTDPRISTSEIVQAFMPGSRVMKTFHHIETTTSRAKPARPGQLAARRSSSPVTTLVNVFGFDPAVAGLHTERVRLESGADPFDANVSADELQANLDRFPESQRGRTVSRARAVSSASAVDTG